MSWAAKAGYKKRPEPILTDSDRKRLAALEENPLKVHQRYQAGATFQHPKCKAVIYLKLYGKDQDALKLNIAAHLANFKKADKRWECVKTDLLKSPEMNPFAKKDNIHEDQSA